MSIYSEMSETEKYVKKKYRFCRFHYMKRQNRYFFSHIFPFQTFLSILTTGSVASYIWSDRTGSDVEKIKFVNILRNVWNGKICKKKYRFCRFHYMKRQNRYFFHRFFRFRHFWVYWQILILMFWCWKNKSCQYS